MLCKRSFCFTFISRALNRPRIDFYLVGSKIPYLSFKMRYRTFWSLIHIFNCLPIKLFYSNYLKLIKIFNQLFISILYLFENTPYSKNKSQAINYLTIYLKCDTGRFRHVLEYFVPRVDTANEINLREVYKLFNKLLI
jgi:hypothetical protein